MATLEVGEHNLGPVKLSNCGFWGVPETRAQVVKHGPSSLILTACHFSGWDAAQQGDACIQADGGRLVVNGYEFMDEKKTAILLEKGLEAANITGCLFRHGQKIDHLAGIEAQMGYNSWS